MESSDTPGPVLCNSEDCWCVKTGNLPSLDGWLAAPSWRGEGGFSFLSVPSPLFLIFFNDLLISRPVVAHNYHCQPPPPPQPHTCQVHGAVRIALTIRVALFDGGSAVAECGGEDGRAMLHQCCADGSVVAGGGTVQWRPGGGRVSEREVPTGRAILPRSQGPTLRPARAPWAHQPWLSGELTLAPAAMRKSTMG